ncbi:MAG TPA: RHS repeat-associated core domain-containing protein, partial [Pirellulales bacterium]|nr:RHS repeat-associated core domain-containing protein [Pirellulales bacterium]
LNSYSYNADQQLTAVTQQDVNGGNVVASKEADFAYNALGQVTDTWAYNTLGGPRTDVYHGAYGYDGDSRLTSLAYTSNAGATTIDSFGWTYNAASLVTSFTSNNGTASYAYDPTNQLTSAGYTTANGGNQPANESYSYTVNGNRNSTGYSTGSDNLITSDGTFNYQHDADGNTTVRTRISGAYAADYKTTFTWDYRNRLTDVDYYDNSDVLTKHVHYVYDVFNHLIATDVDSTGSGSYDIEQHDVLDVTPEVPLAGLPGMAPAPPVLEFDAGGALTDRVFEAMGRILAQGSVSSPTTADVPNWMLTNNQGSVVYVLDNTGAVVDQIVYNSFGAVAYESNPSVAHFAGYAGGHVDFFTGLVDDDNRWYDPIDAKWLSNDPAGFLAGDPDLSCYGLNDPTNRTDPTGLDSGPGVWDNFIYYASHPSAMPTSYYVGYVAAGAIAATAAAAAMAIWVSGMVAANAAAAAAGEAEAAAAKAGMQAAAKDAVMAEIGQGTFPGAIGPWNGPVWWNLPPNPLGPFGPGPFPLGPF